MEEDLNLPELKEFYSTERYHNVLNFNVTDGIVYIMQNGYSWFVTDMLSVLLFKFKNETFFNIELKVKDSKGVATIDDGNGNILYTQKYEYTAAKRDLKLFCSNKVLMLPREY